MMNKFTIFTLFLSSIIVVIVAEILVNDYLHTPYSLEGAANVFDSGVSGASQQNNSGSSSTQAVQAGSLSSELFKKAGIENYTFQSAPFGGKLLDRIPLTDMSVITTYESHLLKNGVARVASFYEFNPGSGASALEVYDLLKQKCSAEIGVLLNETNDFGDGSFYVNYFEYPEKVFVVFRKGDKVFAFTYGKELHSAMAKLISLL